jgi:hypothetical protein
MNTCTNSTYIYCPVWTNIIANVIEINYLAAILALLAIHILAIFTTKFSTGLLEIECASCSAL